MEYLERLLSDVEKYRESGTDPALLFEAPTNRMSTSSDLIAENNEGDEVISVFLCKFGFLIVFSGKCVQKYNRL